MSVAGGIEGVAGAAGEALVADAAAQELKAGREGRRAGDACANCAAKLQGPHCHMCGQVADDLHRPFWTLIKDAVEGLFAVDGRFLRTVPALLFQPGRVSKGYLDGARARYVAPFRLYLVAALVFLLAVSTVTGDWTDVDLDGPPANPEEIADAQRKLEDQAEAARDSGDATRAAILDEVSDELATAEAGRRVAADAAADGENPEIERARQRQEMKCGVRRDLLPEELGPGCTPRDKAASDAAGRGPGVDVDRETGDIDFSMNDEMLTWPIEVRRFIVHQAETIIDDPSRFLEAVNRWISRVLISLFPVYALLLGVMNFWKRRFFYYDHLVVSLHFHAFLFLMLSLLIAASVVVPWYWLCVVFFIWSNLYLYKTHRLVYGSGRFTSALRTLVLDFVYLIVLSFTPIILVVGGFLTV
jgi:hypothetical protein